MGVCGSKLIIEDKIFRKALEDKTHKGTKDTFLNHKKVLGNTVPLTPKCQHYCRNNLERGDTKDFFNAPVFSPFSPLIAKKIDLSSTFLSPPSVILSPMAWFPLVEELYSDASASTASSSQDRASLSPSSLNSVEPDVLSACKQPHEAKHFLLSGDKLLPGEFLTSPKGNFYLILNEFGNLILYTSCDWEDSNILWSSNTALILEERLKSMPPSINPPTFWLEMLPDGDVALLLSSKPSLPLTPTHLSSSANSTNKQRTISDKEQRVGEEIFVLWRKHSTAQNLSSSPLSSSSSSSSSHVPSTKSAN